jgi:hypothetical protein
MNIISISVVGLILFIIIIIIYINSTPNATIVSGDATPDITGMTTISLNGIRDTGTVSIGKIDDGSIPIPTNMSFLFFGTDYGLANTIYWNSNNSLIFGAFEAIQNSVNISSTMCRAILLGNYDRVLTGLSYKKTSSVSCTIVTILPTFTNYYTDTTGSYQMVIRLIKEKFNKNRQWVEVTIITSPISTGYSNNSTITYPSGKNSQGQNIDSNGNTIDPTKRSPYNITNGQTFLNPCDTMYSTASPSSGTTMLFQSDATGTTWSFLNHKHIK